MSKYYSGLEVFEAYARIVAVNQYVKIYMNLTGKKGVIQAEKLGMNGEILRSPWAL